PGRADRPHDHPADGGVGRGRRRPRRRPGRGQPAQGLPADRHDPADHPPHPPHHPGVAATFLYALTRKQPDPQVARDFDVVLVLYADHTLNASTFAGRVAAATLADMYAAVTAAVATLQGPLHGGAITEVREMLEEIGTPDQAPDWVGERLAAKQKVMGFGHRVYKTWDPRATVLHDIAERLGRQFGEPH